MNLSEKHLTRLQPNQDIDITVRVADNVRIDVEHLCHTFHNILGGSSLVPYIFRNSQEWGNHKTVNSTKSHKNDDKNVYHKNDHKIGV